jgi:hypothetical protein
MTTFRSTLVVHNKLVVRIPEEIGDICDEIQDRFRNDEFSILCKAEWGPKGFTLSRTEWTIPIQKISGGSVDYNAENLLELKQQGYNTVIHSHPFSMKSFSGRDIETICTHFPCSVLYCMGDFTDATLSVAISPGHTFQSKAEVDCIHYSNVELPEDGLKNITKFYQAPAALKDNGKKWKGKYEVKGSNSIWKNQYEETQQQLLGISRVPSRYDPDVLDIETPVDEVLKRLRTDVVDLMTENSNLEPELLEDGAFFRGNCHLNGGVRDGNGLYVRGRYFEVPRGYRPPTDDVGLGSKTGGKHGGGKHGGNKGNKRGSDTAPIMVKLEPEEAREITERFIDRHLRNVAALKGQGAIP